jgi:N-dimethylarginine dimethylaminohydrolase
MIEQANARLLMCRPDHFGVVYAINPWMDPAEWQRGRQLLGMQSQRQWTGLYGTLARLGAAIELLPPVAGLPDLVFTANSAVVLDGTALLARFRHPERQAEEPHFRAAFQRLQARGVIDRLVTLPDGLVLEGAGDCVFDAARDLFWMGYGPRSQADSQHVVREAFGIDVIALELCDPRFYHMDTALSALPNGELMYVPAAFTAAGHATIEERVPKEQRLPLAESDACRFAANAVCIGNAVVMSACSDRLRAVLSERGYRVVTTPLGAFQRSGGSAFCLTLRLDRHSHRGAAAAAAPVRKVAAGVRSR